MGFVWSYYRLTTILPIEGDVGQVLRQKIADLIHRVPQLKGPPDPFSGWGALEKN